MKLLKFSFAIALTAPLLVQADSWTGKVVSVQSGDQLTVKHGYDNVRIHLAGLDAPDKGEPGFRAARDSLADYCRQGRLAQITADLSGSGVREGTVACKWSGGYTDMALYQLEQGWVRIQPGTTNPEMVSLQNKAMRYCFGLWRSDATLCGSGWTSPGTIGTGASSGGSSSSSGGSYSNSYSSSSNRTCFTGPRGGRYYYTSSGKKVYRC